MLHSSKLFCFTGMLIVIIKRLCNAELLTLLLTIN